MTDWFLETGLYLLGVALIPVTGLLLVCVGIWGDRSKGRSRCPKCWYDMRGSLPRLECPECGHDAGHEHQLYKHHRRWGRAIVGVVLVLMSAYPLTIVGGWWREASALRRHGITSVDFARIGPVWLVDRLPDELARFFNRVEFLRLDDPAKLAACRSLRHLHKLRVNRGLVTDADLVHLQGLSKLKKLHLTSSRVSDAGLAHLRGLTKLEHLVLDTAQLTDVGLAHLQGLANLKTLYLTNSRVSDAGIEQLRGLTKLEHLSLDTAQLTDGGLAHLEFLIVISPQVTDVGAAEFKQALPHVRVTTRKASPAGEYWYFGPCRCAQPILGGLF
jgi:hypothetical protein